MNNDLSKIFDNAVVIADEELEPPESTGNAEGRLF
jgi:hypothetical protein